MDSVRRPAALLWWGLTGLAVFAAMGLLIGADPASPFTQPLDDWWRGIVGASPTSGAEDWPVAQFFQQLGFIPGMVLTQILIPVALLVTRRWRSAVFVFVASFLGPGLLSQGMKNLVDRPRPAADSADLYAPLLHVDHGSFPSGHAISAATIVVVVAALIPAARKGWLRAWWTLGALLMAGMVWQRTLINAHWLSDALIGLVAGSAGVFLLWWAFWPLLQHDQQSRTTDTKATSHA